MQDTLRSIYYGFCLYKLNLNWKPEQFGQTKTSIVVSLKLKIFRQDQESKFRGEGGAYSSLAGICTTSLTLGSEGW